MNKKDNPLLASACLAGLTHRLKSLRSRLLGVPPTARRPPILSLKNRLLGKSSDSVGTPLKRRISHRAFSMQSESFITYLGPEQ